MDVPATTHDEELFKTIGKIAPFTAGKEDEEDSATAASTFLPQTPLQALKHIGKQIEFLKALAASPAIAADTGIKVCLRLERVKELCVALVGALGSDDEACRPDDKAALGSRG